LADLQRTVYPHSGHPSSEGRAQDSVSSPAKDRRSANCATQPTTGVQVCHSHCPKLAGSHLLSIKNTCIIIQMWHINIEIVLHCPGVNNDASVLFCISYVTSLALWLQDLSKLTNISTEVQRNYYNW